MFRFAGFELDEQRAELRDRDGAAIKLRPKAFEMLLLFAGNPGRIISKQELMEAVWPNVHVGEDNLFQCIREIRTALSDDHRDMVKLVSGRGYLFAAEVNPPDAAAQSAAGTASPDQPVTMALGPVAPRKFRWPNWTTPAVAGVSVLLALTVAVGVLMGTPTLRQGPPTIAVLPVIDATNSRPGATLSVGITDQLIDGFSKIDGVRVVATSPQTGTSAPLPNADFLIRGELRQDKSSWTLQARLIRAASGEVQSVETVSVDRGDTDPGLQQSRLAAGIGDPIARLLNAMFGASNAPAGNGNSVEAGDAKVAIEQATASINQTSRERFFVAETMLTDALADAPDDVDLQMALANLRMRGIQMVWYDAAEGAAAESSARILLQGATKARPNSIPVLEAYCRFLSATNSFTESLVACARALKHDPWNGQALYLIGLGQLHLGRMEDALATFEEADRYDTPAVSRWTWLLGAGWANALLNRNEEAATWVERSIAVTPATGRSHLLLAAIYHRLGRTEDAEAALARALELRPGSTGANMSPPTRNASPTYIAANRKLIGAMIAAGLPEE